MRVYDLKKLVPKIKSVLKNEFNNDVNFLLCVILPIKDKPINTLNSENKDNNVVINYISTINDDISNLLILEGIKNLIKLERSKNN